MPVSIVEYLGSRSDVDDGLLDLGIEAVSLYFDGAIGRVNIPMEGRPSSRSSAIMAYAEQAVLISTGKKVFGAFEPEANAKCALSIKDAARHGEVLHIWYRCCVR